MGKRLPEAKSIVDSDGRVQLDPKIVERLGRRVDSHTTELDPVLVRSLRNPKNGNALKDTEWQAVLDVANVMSSARFYPKGFRKILEGIARNNGLATDSAMTDSEFRRFQARIYPAARTLSEAQIATESFTGRRKHLPSALTGGVNSGLVIRPKAKRNRLLAYMLLLFPYN